MVKRELKSLSRILPEKRGAGGKGVLKSGEVSIAWLGVCNGAVFVRLPPIDMVNSAATVVFMMSLWGLLTFGGWCICLAAPD